MPFRVDPILTIELYCFRVLARRDPTIAVVEIETSRAACSKPKPMGSSA